MSKEHPDPGRPIASPKVAALLRHEPGSGVLVEPEGGFDELVFCILSGELDAYLEDWALRSKEGFRTTLLAHAVKSCESRLVRALLSRGANPNIGLVVQGGTRKASARDYSTPLGLSGNSEEITRLLLSAGADVNLLSRGDPPLMYAVGKDTGAVRAMLEAGADPLYQGESRSPLRQAICRLPADHEQLVLLRAAAAAQMKGKRKSSLRCKAGKNPVSTAETRGVRTFVSSWLEHDWDWAVSFVKAGRSETSAALHALFPGSERHAPAKEGILDEHRPIFVVELKGMPWTIVFDELGARHLSGRLEEIGAPLSKSLDCEVLGFGRGMGLRYKSGVLVEAPSGSWSPEAAYLDRQVEDHDEEQMDSIDAEVLNRIDRWFAEKEVFVPDACFNSDGLLITLELGGIKRKDVSGHDVVVVKSDR